MEVHQWRDATIVERIKKATKMIGQRKFKEAGRALRGYKTRPLTDDEMRQTLDEMFGQYRVSARK
ncbi:MAG: hypothetical protein AAB573_01365 [Patescibacteria group bacterium]